MAAPPFRAEQFCSGLSPTTAEQKHTDNMDLFLTLLAASVLSSAFGLYHRCPPNVESIGDFYSYCSCTKSSGENQVEVVCQRITEDEILEKQLTRLRNYTVDSLTIKRSNFVSPSSYPFRKLHIDKLIFEEVTFFAASVFRAFTGLEFTLVELHFVKCDVVHWFWGNGRHFTHLKTVRFESTTLPEDLTSEVFTHFPKNIRTLQINGCSVKKLGDKALRRFSHLQRLELNRNKISSLQRSTFAPSLRRLQSISVRSNPLRSIATDIFSGMIRLEFLFLSNAKFSSLTNETFFPVWDQLEEIHFDNINITCDCDSKWMLDVPSFKVFRPPFCNSHGKLLNQLSAQERRQLCQRRKKQ